MVLLYEKAEFFLYKGMKKFLFYLLLLSVANCAIAQNVATGYYRVQNKVTERYIRVIDNRGSVNLSTTDADLGALETKKYFEKQRVYFDLEKNITKIEVLDNSSCIDYLYHTCR